MLFGRSEIKRLLGGELLSRAPVWPLLYLESCARRFDIPWVSEVREDSLVRINREAGLDRMHYLSLDMSCSLVPRGPSLPGDVVEWEVELQRSEDRRTATSRLQTPFGPLVQLAGETKGAAPQIMNPPVEDAADLPKYEWYLDQWLDRGEQMVKHYTRELRGLLEEDDFLVVEGVGPLEMFGMTELVPRIYMMEDAPEQFYHAEEKTLEASILQATTAIENGADAIMFGVRGSEIYSPKIFQQHMLPLIPRLADAVHQAGGYLFVHACGMNTDFVQRGYYNMLKCDLFDGLGPPPEGDVTDLPAVRAKLGKDMCSRGNLSVSKLAEATPEQVNRMTRELLQEVEGYPHIVSASCCVNPATPWDNIRAMAEATRP